MAKNIHEMALCSCVFSPWSQNKIQRATFIGNVHYLLLVDQFSRFPLVACLHRLHSADIISHLHVWFLLFGLPRTIWMDGGPQFQCELDEYCSTYSIVHEKSSPYNPCSNGGTEASMKGIKTLLLHCGPMAFDESIVLFWNTCSSTPADLFFGQPLHLAAPVLTGAFPLSMDPNKSGHTSNQHLPLAVGEAIQVQNVATRLWEEVGTIESVDLIGWSYRVWLWDGTILERNCRFHWKFYGAMPKWP